MAIVNKAFAQTLKEPGAWGQIWKTQSRVVKQLGRGSMMLNGSVRNGDWKKEIGQFNVEGQRKFDAVLVDTLAGITMKRLFVNPEVKNFLKSLTGLHLPWPPHGIIPAPD